MFDPDDLPTWLHRTRPGMLAGMALPGHLRHRHCELYERFIADLDGLSSRELVVLTLLVMENRMGQLEDLGAALDAATQHLTDTGVAVTDAATRVSKDVAGLQDEIKKLEDQLQGDPGAPDLSPFIEKARLLSATAETLRQVAAAIDPGSTTISASGTPGPQPVDGKPLYTLGADVPIDSNWTLTDLKTTTDGLLYTYGPDNAGGPATGDGLGGAWHLYTGDVVQALA